MDRYKAKPAVRAIDAVALRAGLQRLFDERKAKRDRAGLSAIVEAELLVDTAPTMAAAPVVRAYWSVDNCANCGYYVYRGDQDNYCPHCGAKMDEGEENVYPGESE